MGQRKYLLSKRFCFYSLNAAHDFGKCSHAILESWKGG